MGTHGRGDVRIVPLGKVQSVAATLSPWGSAVLKEVSTGARGPRTGHSAEWPTRAREDV